MVREGEVLVVRRIRCACKISGVGCGEVRCGVRDVEGYIPLYPLQFCNVFTAEDEMDEEDPTKNYKVGPRKYPLA